MAKLVTQTKKQSENAMRVCPHGSTYCFCRHNLASAIAVPGRPKYTAGTKQSKKPKDKPKEVPFDSGVRK